MYRRLFIGLFLTALTLMISSCKVEDDFTMNLTHSWTFTNYDQLSFHLTDTITRDEFIKAASSSKDFVDNKDDIKKIEVQKIEYKIQYYGQNTVIATSASANFSEVNGSNPLQALSMTNLDLRAAGDNLYHETPFNQTNTNKFCDMIWSNPKCARVQLDAIFDTQPLSMVLTIKGTFKVTFNKSLF